MRERSLTVGTLLRGGRGVAAVPEAQAQILGDGYAIAGVARES